MLFVSIVSDRLKDEKELLLEADLVSPDLSAIGCGTGAVKKVAERGENKRTYGLGLQKLYLWPC